MKMILKTMVCLAVAFSGTAGAANYSPEKSQASLALKVPGNPAVEYPLTLSKLSDSYFDYEWKAKEKIPVTIFQQISTVDDKQQVTVVLTALMALPLAQVVAMEARGREQQRENSARKTENRTPEVELEQAIKVAYPPSAAQAAVVIWEVMELQIQAAVLVMRLAARTTEAPASLSFVIHGGLHNGKINGTYRKQYRDQHAMVLCERAGNGISHQSRRPPRGYRRYLQQW